MLPKGHSGHIFPTNILYNELILSSGPWPRKLFPWPQHPVYCFVFLLFAGVAKARKSLRLITQADAEAIVFGIIVGALIPSVTMLVLKHTSLPCSLPPRFPQSGYRIIQALLIGCFIVILHPHHRLAHD